MCHSDPLPSGVPSKFLAACSFDMCFFYCFIYLTGSAADSYVTCVYSNTHKNFTENELVIPPGTFYLADAELPLSDSLLVHVAYKGGPPL